MADVPAELWVRIFNHLIWDGMIQAIELTCKKFHKIMSELVKPPTVLRKNTIFLA